MRRACVIALLPLLLFSARADEKPDLKTILDAWKAREQDTKSFDFSWWSKRFESRSAGLDNLNPVPQRVAMQLKPEITYIAKSRYLMDDQARQRVERSGKVWLASKSDFVPSTILSIFDGRSYKTQFNDDPPELSVVYLCNRDLWSGKDHWIDPLTIAYRPFSTFGKPRHSAKSETVDGKQLIVIELWYGEVWIDPTKNWLPVRYIVRNNGLDRYRTDITYQDDQIDGWVPQKWNIARLNEDGHLNWSESATVIGHAINKPTDSSTFKLDLNAGAIVVNYDLMQVYVMQADGTQRMVAQDEDEAVRIRDRLSSLQVDSTESGRQAEETHLQLMEARAQQR